MGRVTSLLVSRLILNLKIAASRDYIDDTSEVSYIQNQTRMEALVLGNISNKVEGDSLESRAQTREPTELQSTVPVNKLET